jgi:exosome complex component RRP41
MPLDTSSYALALLRLDGRRWNELRRLTAQISSQAAADGSSYLEMGNTKVICTVSGPAEGKGRTGAGAGSSGDAMVVVEIGLAGFSGVDRKKVGRNDKYVVTPHSFLCTNRWGQIPKVCGIDSITYADLSVLDRRISEMQTTIANAFTSTIFTHLYPHSTITINLHCLSQDGSLLAACLNATTLALIDAGIPIRDYICACTAGSTSSYSSNDEKADPLLDLNGVEEQELPFLTVATLGESDRVSVLVMETRVQAGRLEGMLAVGVDGCGQVRSILDAVVRARGKNILRAGA